jgi:hypothetical protein
MSTNRKNTNVWGIPSMETYLTSIMIRKKIAYINTEGILFNVKITR